MDTKGFFQKVLPASGNYTAVACHLPSGKMAQRMIPRGDSMFADAAGFVSWASSEGFNAYYAMATFTVAEMIRADARGRLVYRGARTQENAFAVKCFWVDVDIQRPGQSKPNCYSDRAAFEAWLASFLRDTGLPTPNLWVSSGFGLHIYWVLIEDMSAADWQPYADALKAALIKHGFTGDAGISADRARILRPPGTINCKDPNNKRAVVVYDDKTGPNYINEDVLSKLRPYVNATTASSQRTGATITQLKPKSASKLNAAGQSGHASHGSDTVHNFARILPYCEQLRTSVDTHGANRTRNHWVLADLNTLAFCEDGEEYVHKISDGYHKYDEDETKTVWAQVLKEKAEGKFAPPLCTSFHSYVPDVCERCPLWGKIKIPLHARPDGDLPVGYRRQDGWIEWLSPSDGWAKILRGDVLEAKLHEVNTAYQIRFRYEFMNKPHYVRICANELKFEPGQAHALWSGMGLQVDLGRAKGVSVFVNSWIEQLRLTHDPSSENLQPFGWLEDTKGNTTAFAIGGIVYRLDGSRDFVVCSDPELAQWYAPRGDVATWKEAAAFACAGRIEAQIIVACSFGAPLMKLTEQGGVTFSLWSQNSGIGKSSAVAIGQTVWGSLAAVTYRSDTEGAKRVKLAAAQVLPQYQDEMQVDEWTGKQAVSSLYDVAQGRGRQRLRQDATLRPPETWSSISVITGNAPMLDHVLAHKSFTDAGAVRLFEARIDRPTGLHDPEAQNKIMAATKAWGTAGAIYGEYIATHFHEVQATRQKLAATITKEVQAQDAERFYVAGVSCVLTGAMIARKLGLFEFDVPAMWRFLRGAWLDLRASREENAPLAKRTFLISEVFDQFMHDMQLHRLVTSHFRGRGRTDSTFDVIQWPASGKNLHVQIGCDEALCAIERAKFNEWCRVHHMSADDMLARLKDEFGAVVARRLLGAGTQHAAGQVVTIEVPLIGALDIYLARAKQKPEDALPPSMATPGNKPKS